MDSHEMTRISRAHRKLERLYRACLMADASIMAARSGAWEEAPRSMVEALGLLREARDELQERMKRVSQEGQEKAGGGVPGVRGTDEQVSGDPGAGDPDTGTTAESL